MLLIPGVVLSVSGSPYDFLLKPATQELPVTASSLTPYGQLSQPVMFKASQVCALFFTFCCCCCFISGLFTSYLDYFLNLPVGLPSSYFTPSVFTVARVVFVEENHDYLTPLFIYFSFFFFSLLSLKLTFLAPITYRMNSRLLSWRIGLQQLPSADSPGSLRPFLVLPFSCSPNVS